MADLLGAIKASGILVLYLLFGIVTCKAALSAYRITLHPLARVPGPRLAAISNVWYAYHVRNGHAASLGRTLHKRYGPVVRVGPNEVWFNTPEAFDTIYSTGPKGLEKSDFYLATSLSKPSVDHFLRTKFPDNLDLLSERDMRRYRLQRRLIGPIYRASNVIKYEKAVDDILGKVMQVIKDFKSQEIDLKEWMHIISVECLGASVLSWSPGMLKAGSDWASSNHSYLGWRRKSVFGLFPIMAKLDLCSSKIARNFGNIWGVTFPPPPGFRAFFPDVGKRVTRRTKVALNPKSQKDNRTDLMSDLIQLHRDRPEFTELYLKKMAITNFGAGHETMASTLTTVFAILGQHKEIQAKVRQEIYHAKVVDLAQLPLTRAVIKEAMRLRPVIAMGLPRKVTASTGLELHGYSLPSGTTVACNPVALHRNEVICGLEPDLFKPERWLGPESQVRVLDKYSLAWGGGSRGCPGRHLAEMIVTKTVISILEKFQVDTTVPPDEKMPSYFLSMMTDVGASFQLILDLHAAD